MVPFASKVSISTATPTGALPDATTSFRNRMRRFFLKPPPWLTGVCPKGEDGAYVDFTEAGLLDTLKRPVPSKVAAI